jgi:hypothetical protein
MMKPEEKAELMGLLIIELQQESVPRSVKRRLSGRHSVEKTVILDKN